MREFRFLEEKRKLTALSEAEEHRWIELGQMLGIFEAGDQPPQPEPQHPQGYYAEDGNWYPYDNANPPELHAQPQQGAYPPQVDALGEADLGELIRFAESPQTSPDNSEPVQNGGFLPPESAGGWSASALQSPGFLPPFDAPESSPGGLEANSDDVMEVDPNDVFLVEQGADASTPASDPSAFAAQASGASAQSEDSCPEGDAAAGEASLQLTKNCEWIPDMPAQEGAVPLETATPQELALQPDALSPEPLHGAPETDPVVPSEASLPLTKNFEWIPEMAPPESSVPLDPGAAGWSDVPAVHAPQGEPNPEAGALLADQSAAQIGPAGHPVEAPLADESAASDSPVIDLLESDAAVNSDPPLDHLEIEPVAQWTQEPERASWNAPAPAQPEEHRDPSDLNGAHPAEGASGTESSEASISGSGPPSFQFEFTAPGNPPQSSEPQRTLGTSAPSAVEAARDSVNIVSPAALAGSQTSDTRASDWNDAPAVAAPEVSRTASEQAPADAGTQFGDGQDLLSASFVQGERRVVVHLLDGQVKRGTVRDLDLMAGSVPVHLSTGADEDIPIARVKAIFFMLAPGSAQPVPHGQKIRLTFQDGREVVGFSHDYKTGDPGFFVTLADARTNTERILVLRWSILAIVEL